MSQRFLKYETEQDNPLVDEYGVIKSSASASGSSQKKRHLIFENLNLSPSDFQEDPSGKYAYIELNQYNDVCAPFNVALNDARLFQKYRLVLFISGDNYCKMVTIQYDNPAVSGKKSLAVYATSTASDIDLGFVRYSAFEGLNNEFSGQLSIQGPTGQIYTNYTVTCYLEEL